MNEGISERGTLEYLPHEIKTYDQTEEWYLPYFRGLTRFAVEDIDHYEKFKWVSDLGGDLRGDLQCSSRSELVNIVPSRAYFSSKISYTGEYHPYGAYWRVDEVIPGYVEHAVKDKENQIRGFRKHSDHHLWYHWPAFEILFDSKFQHPDSHFAYSAMRVDRNLTKPHRRHFYGRNWNKLWPIMGQMTDMAMMLQHDLIIMEPTCMGQMVFRRIIFGTMLNYACVSFSLVTFLLSHYNTRWPSFFIFPCLLANYCAYIYAYEYTLDPVYEYSYWTSWINDPDECEALPLIKLPGQLLREEHITFMQVDNQSFRRTVNGFFCNFCNFYCLRTLFRRLKYNDTAADVAWENLKQTVGATTGRAMYHIIGLKNHRCTYKPEAGYPERMLSWFSITVLVLAVFFRYFDRVKKIFDVKSRTRLKINEYTFRALMGERRYRRSSELFYHSFRQRYPREDLGVRDWWYFSQRDRHNPGSHQFYY